jgi:spore coat polysaccharide biosynthesis protein SpsF
MRVVAIIQARMGSTRLPGKVLKDICGETMLSRVVNRVKRSGVLDEILVATSSKPKDQAIMDEAKLLGVSCFIGSEDDVLDRYYNAAINYDAETVVRVTSDCPLIDPAILDMVVKVFLKRKSDYTSNTIVRTYPRGLDVEVMSMSALTTAWRNADKTYQRTHVTPYIYENSDCFRLISVTGVRDYSCYRWTVDTLEDLEFIRNVYSHFRDRNLFDWNDVLSLCEKNSSLTHLNNHVEQKPIENS